MRSSADSLFCKDFSHPFHISSIFPIGILCIMISIHPFIQTRNV